METSTFIPAFVAATVLPPLVITWAATFLVRRVAPRVGLIDQPAARKVHTAPTPLGGGLAIAAGVLLTFAAGHVLLWSAGSETDLASWVPALARPHIAGLRERMPALWTLLAGAAVLLAVGLLDDRRGLDWRLRLLIQFSVAGFCVVTQGWRLTAFIDLPQLGWIVSVVLSTVWIVALINSFNMLDNMDGLSGGVAALAAAMLAAVMLLAPDPETSRPQLFVAGFLLVLVGGLLGFLIHNRPPARIFMGDAGSYFVGFCIGVTTLLATYAGYQSSARHAILAPLCVMAVPLYDMVTVLWIRLRSGRSPFEADKNHFSHRLVDLGLSKGQAVLTIYLTTATCGLGALLLHRVDLWGAVIVLLMVLCVLTLIAILESTARKKLNGERQS